MQMPENGSQSFLSCARAIQLLYSLKGGEAADDNRGALRACVGDALRSELRDAHPLVLWGESWTERPLQDLQLLAILDLLVDIVTCGDKPRTGGVAIDELRFGAGRNGRGNLVSGS